VRIVDEGGWGELKIENGKLKSGIEVFARAAWACARLAMRNFNFQFSSRFFCFDRPIASRSSHVPF
jgi:hypothetical protein